MPEDPFVDRHLQIWQRRSRFVQQIVLTSVAIGFLLVLNIISAYAPLRREAIAVNERIAAHEREIANAMQAHESSKQLAADMARHGKLVKSSPWSTHKRQLIRTLRAKPLPQRVEGPSPSDPSAKPSSSSPTSVPRNEGPQAHADAALDAISKGVQRDFIAPMRAMLDGREAQYAALHETIDELDEHRRHWVDARRGKPDWWRHIPDNHAAVAELDGGLGLGLMRAEREIARSHAQLEATIERDATAIAKRRKDLRSTTEQLERFEESLDNLLPKWVRGLVTPTQLVALFPGMIACLALYVLFMGLSLTAHFEQWVRRSNIAAHECREPTASSIWTLRDRGPWHTSLSFGVYLVYFVAMWLLYDASVDAFCAAHEITANEERIWAVYGGRGSATEALFIGFGHALIAACGLTILVRLVFIVRDRIEPAKSPRHDDGGGDEEAPSAALSDQRLRTGRQYSARALHRSFSRRPRALRKH